MASVPLERAPLGRRIALWVAGIVVALGVLLGAVLLGLDTAPGHRFLVGEIAGYTTESGISIHPGRIEGSIYSRLTIRDLQVDDPRGAFLTIPQLDLDWRPFAYINKRIDVRAALAPSAVLLRSPALKPTAPRPNQPILPDIDIALGRVRIDRFTIMPAVDGKRHVLGIAGSATIEQGRAQIDATANAVAGPGVAGGDTFRLTLDAVPAANRLLVAVKLNAPAGGMVDSYAHLGKALAINLDGHGDWADWHGRLLARTGGTPLVDLALSGANGHFGLQGTALPNAVLAPGAATRLTSPAVTLAGTAVLGQRNANVTLAAHSAALALTAQGLIDLGNNSFGGFRLGGQLLTPGAMAPGAVGRDVRIAAVLNGPFATPSIDYRLSAGMLGFKTTTIEGLQAQGRATVDATHILVPISATAQRVTGVNAAGGLLDHLSANGTVAYTNGRLMTDNLRLRSAGIDATVVAVADLAHGTYAGAFKGAVNDYHVAGLGHVQVLADAHLVPAASGGFGIAGQVRAVTRSFDSASVRGFLGGNAVLTAHLAYSPTDVASVFNLNIAAPALHVTNGQGRYMPDGRIAFSAAGNSGPYGPFTLGASGTVAKPLVHLHADRPKVGVQLANVDATLTGTGAGYEVRATGGSTYGPFAGDVVIVSRKGPLRFDIKSAHAAGVNLSGSLVQTVAGPFAGGLMLNGSGLNGRVLLAAAGKIQRADAQITASAAHLPTPTPITIGAGSLNATVLMYPNAPAITADARLSDLREGDLILTSAQARVRYQNGHGNVAVVTSGHSGVPFQLAAQAGIDPQHIVVNARGSANGIAFSLAAPANIGHAGGEWQLAPATIRLPQGQVVLSGQYGARTQVHAQIVNMDMSIVQAVMPGLGVGGKASGTVDVALAGGGGIPVSHTRLDIAGFTRTGALTVSDPLDLSVLATTGAQGADVGALIRRTGTTVGRIQARIGAGAGAGWADRLRHGSLSGGIRYAGPAELLWTLSGVSGQDVSGPLALAADFGGRMDAPSVTGVLRASQLRYENDTYGTVISNIALDGRFSQSQFVLNSFSGKAGDGTVSAQGSVGLDAASGYPIDLKATLANARLAKSDAVGATVTGQIAVSNTKAGGAITGDLSLGEVRYQVIRQGAAEVPELTGVHRKGQTVQAAAAENGPAPSRWKLALHVHAPGQIFVSGMGLEAEWSTDMRVSGTAGAPVVVGDLDVVRGTYSFAGKSLDLDNASKVTFDGGAPGNPVLNITASTTVNSITATITITGRAQQPQIAFTSTPALPQDEVLSRLLFGSDVTSLSPTEAIQLAAALNSLRGSGGGFNPLGKLRSVAGFDRLRILGANPATGQGTSLAAGKYITRNVYVEVVTDTRGFTATQLEVALTKALSVLSSTGSFGGSNVSLRYRKDH